MRTTPLQTQFSKVVCAGLGAAAGALMLGGCGLGPIEDEGDKEPTVGRYQVTLPVVVTLGPQKTSETIDLSVKCMGDHLPPNCDANDPMWTIRGENSLLNVEIPAVPGSHSPNTKLNISLTPEAFLHEKDLGSFGEVVIPYQVAVTPPPNLNVTGLTIVNVNLAFPPPGGEREEQPAGKGYLTAKPRLVRLSSGPLTAVRTIEVDYRGPSTTIQVIALGLPNPEKFTMTAPPRPFTVRNRQHFAITVSFLGAPDSQQYNSLLSIVAANGTSETVDVFGKQ